MAGRWWIDRDASQLGRRTSAAEAWTEALLDPQYRVATRLGDDGAAAEPLAELAAHVAWPLGDDTAADVDAALARFQDYFSDPARVPLLWGLRSYYACLSKAHAFVGDAELAEALLAGPYWLDMLLDTVTANQAREMLKVSTSQPDRQKTLRLLFRAPPG